VTITEEGDAVVLTAYRAGRPVFSMTFSPEAAERMGVRFTVTAGRIRDRRAYKETSNA
jgi:hypothetical protein